MSRLNLKTFAEPGHQVESGQVLVLHMTVFADSRVALRGHVLRLGNNPLHRDGPGCCRSVEERL